MSITSRSQYDKSGEETSPLSNRKQADIIESKIIESNRTLQDQFHESQLELAHEINNPVNLILTAVNGVEQIIDEFTMLILKYQNTKSIDNDIHYATIKAFEEKIDVPSSQEDLKNAFDIMKRACFKVKEITSIITTEDEESTLIDVDVNECLEASILLHSLEKHNIKLHKSFEEGLPSIKAPRGRLNQVFTNLIQNAFDAIYAKGIEKDARIDVLTYRENKELVVQIKDNGIGMCATTQEKLFERYYTTKQGEHIRGIGMPLVQKIITSCQGHISFDTEEGKGTVFTIQLPIAD